MRKLGEQWVEYIYGKNHMVKNVFNGSGNKVCFHCTFSDIDWRSPSHVICRYGKPCPIKEGYIKDLGIVNDEGCLPEERTGLYPTIRPFENSKWCVAVRDIKITVLAYGDTRQEAIDAWNRRV